MHWRIGSDYRHRSPDANRATFRTIVATGPPPGLLALDGDIADGLILSPLRVTDPLLEALAAGRLPIVVIGSLPSA